MQDINLPNPINPGTETGEIYTISQLNRAARNLLEHHFPAVWVEGEISNFVAPNSGHWYFSLKDEYAQIRCALFRMQQRSIDFRPENGLHVLAKARVSLYEGRGDYQLIIEYMEEAGVGRLRKAFELLKKKLSDAGLFDPIHKKALPRMPKCVGVITSPTGAAIRDILNVLNRRFPYLPVIIYPSLVQGNDAAPNIVSALKQANERKECDVLIVARGGGSLEDLWPFNEESVAQAIFDSEIPIVTGIGHEIDFTIADFVGDLRAPTPSAAAELISPDKEEYLLTLKQKAFNLEKQLKQQIAAIANNLQWLQKHLEQQHPKRQLLERSQQLDLYEADLIRLQTRKITDYRSNLHHLQNMCSQHSPSPLIQHHIHQLNLILQRQQNSMLNKMQTSKQELVKYAGQLNAYNPLATLHRGYSIASCKEKIIRNPKDVDKGDIISLQLQDGKLDCEVI